MKITDTHVYFYSRTVFSNFYPCKFTDPINNNEFLNSEQAFMWYKAHMFGDFETRTKIGWAKEPGEAKALGRQVRNYNELAWTATKRGFMKYVVYLKFSQNPELKAELLATGDKILVEASKTDEVWGCGLSEDDPRILQTKNWTGMNYLGEALMNVRSWIRADDYKNETKT